MMIYYKPFNEAKPKRYRGFCFLFIIQKLNSYFGGVLNK
jgi:hypothetical protein